VVELKGWSTDYTGYGFYFDKFACSVVECCTEELIYQLATTNTEPPTLVNASDYTITWDATPGIGQMVLKLTSSSVLGATGDYYIYVTNSGSKTIKAPYQHTFSPKIRWTIICGPKSVTITEGAYPTTPVTFLDEQDVP